MNHLNLGCGVRPLDGFVNHDRTKHDDFVDQTWDLNTLPWPWAHNDWSEVRADDVFEHLELPVDRWLEACWVLLIPGGELSMRLPAFDNHLSFRDPTHKKVFHPETFYYWDPTHHLYQEFGRYYWDSVGLWAVSGVEREEGDFRYQLVKLDQRS